MNPDDIRTLYADLKDRRLRGEGVDYEAIVQLLCTTCLQPGDTAIDVGAHLGYHTFTMAKAVGESGQVHAFEPLEDLFATVQQAVQDTPQYRGVVKLYSCALSTYTGTATFYRAEGAPGYSGLQIREYDSPDVKPVPFDVSVRQLDELFPEKKCSLIKIDVEGGEFDVLRGGRNLLKASRPVCIFEFGRRSYDAYDVDVNEVYEYFDSLDYVIFDILGNELNSLELFRCSDETGGLWDYFALHRNDPRRSALAEELVKVANDPSYLSGR